MPKSDNVKRIDLPTGLARASVTSNAALVTIANADTVDGFHASAIPRGNALLALDENGYIPRMAIPRMATDQATGHTGVQYIGPTALLLDPLAYDAVSMIVSAPVLPVDSRAVLSYYQEDNEVIHIVGPAMPAGDAWSYAIERAKSGTSARSFPKGTEVIGMGKYNSGGYLILNSANGVNSPHIDCWENTTAAVQWRARFGRLSALPASFTSLFPSSINWDTFGLAAENAFLSGGVYAQYGNIAGDLDMSGKLTVSNTASNAKLEFGDTVAGWGMAYRDGSGRPRWLVAGPYEDEDGNASEFAFVIDSYGDRALYYRYDASEGEWVLDIGPWRVRKYSFVYGNNIAGTDVENGRHWMKTPSLVYPRGYEFDVLSNTFEFNGTVSIVDKEIASGVYTGSILNVDYSNLTTVNVVGLFVTNQIHLNYTHGSSSKDPATDAPDTWLKIYKNGTSYYVPAYAAS